MLVWVSFEACWFSEACRKTGGPAPALRSQVMRVPACTWVQVRLRLDESCVQLRGSRLGRRLSLHLECALRESGEGPFKAAWLVNQCGGMVPLGLPRHQCGQRKQSCAVVRILTAPPQERADPKPEKHTGRHSSVLAGGVLGVALTSREELEPHLAEVQVLALVRVGNTTGSDLPYLTGRAQAPLVSSLDGSAKHPTRLGVGAPSMLPPSTGAALISEETWACGWPAGLHRYYEAVALISRDYCWNFLRSPKLFLESNRSSKLLTPFPLSDSTDLLLGQEISISLVKKYFSEVERKCKNLFPENWVCCRSKGCVCAIPRRHTRHSLSKCAYITVAGDKGFAASKELWLSPGNSRPVAFFLNIYLHHFTFVDVCAMSEGMSRAFPPMGAYSPPLPLPSSPFTFAREKPISFICFPDTYSFVNNAQVSAAYKHQHSSFSTFAHLKPGRDVFRIPPAVLLEPSELVSLLRCAPRHSSQISNTAALCRNKFASSQNSPKRPLSSSITTLSLLTGSRPSVRSAPQPESRFHRDLKSQRQPATPAKWKEPFERCFSLRFLYTRKLSSGHLTAKVELKGEVPQPSKKLLQTSDPPVGHRCRAGLLCSAHSVRPVPPPGGGRMARPPSCLCSIHLLSRPP
ncbi:hypothetical protein HPG69_010751, partial [Diceros bicornis minor]